MQKNKLFTTIILITLLSTLLIGLSLPIATAVPFVSFNITGAPESDNFMPAEAFTATGINTTDLSTFPELMIINSLYNMSDAAVYIGFCDSDSLATATTGFYLKYEYWTTNQVRIILYQIEDGNALPLTNAEISGLENGDEFTVYWNYSSSEIMGSLNAYNDLNEWIGTIELQPGWADYKILYKTEYYASSWATGTTTITTQDNQINDVIVSVTIHGFGNYNYNGTAPFFPNDLLIFTMNPAQGWAFSNITFAGELTSYENPASFELSDGLNEFDIYFYNVDPNYLYATGTPTPQPTTTPNPQITQFETNFFNYLAPLIFLLAPAAAGAIILGKWGAAKWGFITGLNIGAILCYLYVDGFGLWAVIIVVIIDALMIFNTTRQGGD